MRRKAAKLSNFLASMQDAGMDGEPIPLQNVTKDTLTEVSPASQAAFIAKRKSECSTIDYALSAKFHKTERFGD